MDRNNRRKNNQAQASSQSRRDPMRRLDLLNLAAQEEEHGRETRQDEYPSPNNQEGERSSEGNSDNGVED